LTVKPTLIGPGNWPFFLGRKSGVTRQSGVMLRRLAMKAASPGLKRDDAGVMRNMQVKIQKPVGADSNKICRTC
jgi:hypothetical protein